MTTRIGSMLLGAVLIFAGSVVGAQSRDGNVERDLPPVVVDVQVAHTVDTGSGRVGQRQTREDAASKTGVEPMARFNNRIANRVQTRLRNRIDRTYDPQANAASPFVVANDQIRAVGRPRR